MVVLGAGAGGLVTAAAAAGVGARVALIDIPGLEDAPYLTNATIFNLTELPARMGVIGSGPIGLELAQAFQRLGSQVTVFSRGGEILAKEDRDAAALVEDSMRRDGVRFLRHVEYRRVDSRRGKPPITLVVESAGGEQALELDALLVAAGRKPAVAGLGLERAGVVYDGRMGVRVDERLQTTNPTPRSRTSGCTRRTSRSKGSSSSRSNGTWRRSTAGSSTARPGS